MASVMKLHRALLPKVFVNFCSITTRDISRNFSYLKIRRSNNVLSVGNYSRWSASCHMYSTSTSNSTKQSGDSGASSVAGQLAKELLDAKLKEGKTKDGLSSEAEEKTQREEQENARRALKFSFIAFGVMISTCSGMLIFRWGAPPEDEKGNRLTDELSHLPILQQYLKRTARELRTFKRVIQEPSRELLLPPPVSGEYYQPPYTLVLELKDVLVHPEWTYETGWRFKKRPGLDFLLQHCGPPVFEIVVYTTEAGFTALPLIEKLDEKGYIWYKLFKDSTLYINGKHVKELNSLNRDLKKVIMVDWDGDAVSCRRNQLQVPRWDGRMDDKGLTQLALLLRTIAESEVDDVRDVLDYYRQFSDPLDTYTRLQAEALERESAEMEMRKSQVLDGGPIKPAVSWKPSFLKKWL